MTISPLHDQSVEKEIDRTLELRKSPSSKSLDAELYRLGKTLRHLQPPGGTEHGVFDAFKFPCETPPTPKKFKDYQKSDIFGESIVSPPRPVTPKEKTTHYKLFEMSPPPTKPCTRNRMKSTVFEPEPKVKPKKPFIKINPITGEDARYTGQEKRVKRYTVRNPITFEGVAEKHVPSRCKQPPGGLSSIKLEYNEKPLSN